MNKTLFATTTDGNLFDHIVLVLQPMQIRSTNPAIMDPEWWLRMSYTRLLLQPCPVKVTRFSSTDMEAIAIALCSDQWRCICYVNRSCVFIVWGNKNLHWWEEISFVMHFASVVCLRATQCTIIITVYLWCSCAICLVIKSFRKLISRNDCTTVKFLV